MPISPALRVAPGGRWWNWHRYLCATATGFRVRRAGLLRAGRSMIFCGWKVIAAPFSAALAGGILRFLMCQQLGTHPRRGGNWLSGDVEFERGRQWQWL